MTDVQEPNDDIEPDETEAEYHPTKGTLAHNPEFGDVDDDDAVDANDEAE